MGGMVMSIVVCGAELMMQFESRNKWGKGHQA